MKKNILLVTALSLFCSCTSTKYIEKQSEPLKQAVYGVNDSLKEARIDLAWFYSNETTKLVGPPLKRISIKPLYETTTTTNSVGARILVVPEELKNTKVIVIGSDEYKELLKNKEIAQQVTEELAIQKKVVLDIDKQRQINEQNQLKLIDDYNKAQLTIQKKDAAIWYRNFVILGLLVLIVGYIGLRVAIAYGKIAAPFII
jgi:plasmid maintenance system antidote protein VapI